MRVIDLKYVRRNPALSVSFGISILVIVSSILAYYYKSEGSQDQRQFSTEIRLQQLVNDVDNVARRQERILQVVVDKQDSILLNIKALKAKR